MKNIQVFAGADLKRVIQNLFVTTELQELVKTDYFDRLYQYPVWFYNPSDPVERSHFTSFFRHLAYRNYDNPNITDLYYLHELTHMMWMTTGETSYENFCDVTSFEDWYKAMNKVEFKASLMSEVTIYFKYRSLRAKTFKMEIWADRFLNDAEFMALPYDEQVFYASVDRKKAMVMPIPGDEHEKIIHKYNSQNKSWADVWNPQFIPVNCHMSYFINMCQNDIQGAIEFLESFIAINSIDAVPFRAEAQKFHDLVSGTVVTLFKTP